MDLKGLEGELVEVVEKYQGKQLSANLPYKTLFMIPKDDGKDQKLIAHLVRKHTEQMNVRQQCSAITYASPAVPENKATQSISFYD